MTGLKITDIEPGACIAADDTIRMDVVEIAPGDGLPPVRNPVSDEVMLFLAGSGEITTADRVFPFVSVCHAYVPAGTAYELHNTGDEPLRFVRGMCPNGPRDQGVQHDRRGAPGGVTLLSVEQYDRFPDSGLVRGGMFFLDGDQDPPGHSHDGASEVFVFLNGEVDLIVEGQRERVRAGQAVYVPPELKHQFEKPSERLDIWSRCRRQAPISDRGGLIRTTRDRCWPHASTSTTSQPSNPGPLAASATTTTMLPPAFLSALLRSEFDLVVARYCQPLSPALDPAGLGDILVLG